MGVEDIIIIQETYIFCSKDPGIKPTHLVDNPLHMCVLVWLSFSSAGSLQQMLLSGLCTMFPNLEEPHKGRNIQRMKSEGLKEN